MAERLRKIKEEPLIDERIPHPYREVVAELRAMRELLDEIKEKLPVVVPPPVVALPPEAAPPVPVAVAPPAAVVALTSDTIIGLARELAKRILQLPNRVERIKWDTSITTWQSLRGAKKIKPAKALGFWIEDIGGGFEYTIVREDFESDARTAAVDDKWDKEFDDLHVKGAGAGTALIWYWWRAD
jgi:hypothetical protein